ncbi:MAG TPA: phytoene desaturase family protein [Vicinamibacterales bacterium]|nr:phytoene desaturase family protein [Vicinamibacterales bacterium]
MAAQRVIIVGAGVGGLSLSIYLARQGFDVEVLEKHGVAGGRCGVLEREGHRFDLGATLLLMPRLFRAIYADWGERLDEQLQLLPLDPIYDLHFERGSRFRFTPNLPALRAQAESLEPGSFDRVLRCIELGWRQYEGLMGRFLGRNFDGPWDYFTPRNAWDFVRLKAHRNHYRHVRRYFQSEELRAAFTFQNIYVGQSPFATSAAYGLLPAMELAQGGWYPRGGMHAIAGSLGAIAGKAGVRVRYGANVEEITVAAGRATGVRLDDGSRVEADVVAANADLPYVYRRLLPDSRERERLNRLRYTCSAIVFHWGVGRRHPELGHHNIFLGADYRAGFDNIFERRTLSRSPHFYLNRPSSTDPSCAPAGKDTLSAIVPVHHAGGNPAEDWRGLAGRARDAVFRRLARSGCADLSDRIECEVLLTPADWERRLNLTHGSVFGSLDHRITQVGYLRPSNRHPRYSNLYFVGGSTHPGSGVPLALLSGRLTAERILLGEGRSRPVLAALEF